MVNLDNRGRRSLRRGLAVAGCLLLVASAAGAAAVTSRPVAQTHVLSGDQPATATTAVLTRPETEPPPSMPTTTTPSPSAPVTVPGTVPHMPTTTTAVATTTPPQPSSPAETGRPPCAGDPWGTHGYGCTVSRTELPMRVEWSAYGQILQANRDPVQVSLTVKDIEGGLPHAWHIDYGDGTGSDGDPTRYTCGQQIPPFTDSGRHIYSEPGTYNVAVTVTNTRCEYLGGTEGVRWFHDQTMTLTVPVRVCPHITVIAGEVYCIP